MARMGGSRSSSPAGSHTFTPPSPLFAEATEPQEREEQTNHPGDSGLAARAPVGDTSGLSGQVSSRYHPLAPSGVGSSPDRSHLSPRGGGKGAAEEEDLVAHIMAQLPAGTAEHIRDAFLTTAEELQAIEGTLTAHAMSVIDVRDSNAKQQREMAAFTSSITEDMQALEARLESVTECAAEWAGRAKVAEERLATLEATTAAAHELARLSDAAAATAHADAAAAHADAATARRQARALEARMLAVEARVYGEEVAGPQQRRSRLHTPGTAYLSAQGHASSPHGELINLRSPYGSAAGGDDDALSQLSSRSSRSCLRGAKAVLPPRDGPASHLHASSATATVRDAPARPPTPVPFSALANLTQAQARPADAGGLKEDALAQLDGAVRNGANQQAWALTQTLPPRTDLAEQLAAEKAEQDARAAAMTAALEREREQLNAQRAALERERCEMRATLAREARTQRAALDAQQDELEQARSEFAHSVVARSNAGSKPAHGGGGNDPDPSDGSSSTTASSRHTSHRSRRRRRRRQQSTRGDRWACHSRLGLTRRGAPSRASLSR